MVKKRRGFSTISLPTPLIKEVEKIVKEFKYWPRKTDFIREAVVQKIEKYRDLERLRKDDEGSRRSNT